MSFQPPKGTDDILPPESRLWRRILTLWEEMSGRYGYPLMLLPVFEATELFARGVGETTEVVTKHVYAFSDKSGRSLTLRPEGTAGAVRAYLNRGGQAVWKGAYSGPMFRYEQPQAGRRRQFYQVGVEYMGVSSPEADVEVIELGWRYLAAAGVEVELRLNSLGDDACRPRYLADLRRFLDEQRTQLPDSMVSLIATNPLRFLDSGPEAIAEAAPRFEDYWCGPCGDHHRAVLGALEGIGIPYTSDHTLVRGLDYYTRTAWEYIGLGLRGAQNAVGGGGRYDDLAKTLGGKPAPGLGFALGLDRIAAVSTLDPEDEIKVFVVSETGPTEALYAATQLRAEGVGVDFDAAARSVKAQLRTAGRRGVPHLVVVRGDDLVEVRRGGEQKQMPLREVASWIRESS